MTDEKVSSIKMKDVSLLEAKSIVQKILKTKIVPFLWGPPGVGKSSIIREIAKESGWDIIDLRLSLLNPVDLRGLPMVSREENLAHWLPPSFLPTHLNKKQGILFLDEINLAPLSVQAAAYQLILDKRVGEYVFPDHWRIVAAGNREVDKANVFKISAPLANRFIHLTVKDDINVWKDWAVKNLRQEVVDCVYMRPKLLLQMPNGTEKAFPSPRSWQFVSDILTAMDYNEADGVQEDLRQAVMGAVGEGAGKEFIAFLSDYKVQQTRKAIEDFIKTGNLNMPKAISHRYLFIQNVFHEYYAGNLGETKYQMFRDKLSNEEKAAIDSFEQDNREVLESKYNKYNPQHNRGVAVLTQELSSSETGKIIVSNPQHVQKGENIIFDDNGNKEVVKVEMLSPKDIYIVERGLRGTSEQAWSVGSFIQFV